MKTKQEIILNLLEIKYERLCKTNITDKCEVKITKEDEIYMNELMKRSEKLLKTVKE
jgi:hypothetical protein